MKSTRTTQLQELTARNAYRALHGQQQPHRTLAQCIGPELVERAKSKRLVAVGRMSPLGDEMMIDPQFADTFAAGAADAIDATPEPMDMCDSFELGRLDALDGHPCRAGQYDRLTDQCCYALGWRSVAGDNATTLALLEPKPQPEELFGLMLSAMMDEDAHAEETAEYESWMDDVDWMRGGC